MTAIDLGYRPRAWQREVHLKKRRFTVLALHRRAGKTELAIAELVDKALRFDKDLGLFLYICPLLKQAKTVAWLRLKARVGELVMRGLAEINESELWVRFNTNGATLRIYGADNPDAIRGVRLDGVVIDEVADIKPETWSEVIQPALADRKGWALFIGTPHGINLFSDLFFKAHNLPDWHAALYTVYDTDALDPVEVERLRLASDENTFKREMLCDFSAAGDDQLISLSDVHASAGRHLRKDQYDFAAKVLGVDPARFGDDRSVLVLRQGLYAHRPEVYRGLDNMALADKVAQCIERHRPDAVFIDAGNGAGVIDRLRQLHHDVIEVHFSGMPSHARYLNKRAEMWFEMRDWLRGGGVIPDLMALKQELATPTYKFTPADKIQLESKDDIKKRLPQAGSPDMADALALTFAFPVYRSHHVEAQAKRMGILRDDDNPSMDYDPYARL
jgi:hypothetical protein